MQDLHALARQINEVNAANGYDSIAYVAIPTKLMFVVSELEEARSAAHALEPDDPVETELADTAIRLLSILDAVFPDWLDRTELAPSAAPSNVYLPAEVLLWPVISLCVRALEHWRREQRHDVQVSLELALRSVWSISTRLGFDMYRQVVEKVEHNAGRGHLHGTKRSDG